MPALGSGGRRAVRMTKRSERERGPSDEEKVYAGAEMTEVPVGALMMIEAHAVAVMMTVLYAEGWTRTVVHVEALTMTAAQGGVETMTVVHVEALMTTAVPGVASMTTEVPVEARTTPGVPEEEEMMTEVEGEAWMMGHGVVAMTSNPGSPWAGLVSLQPLS